jgi:HlyD family secretion protein
MSRWILGAIVVALIAGGMYTAGAVGKADQSAAPQQVTPVPTVKAGDRIVVEGKVVPIASVELRFPSSGVVAEILVKEGDQVAVNMPLARLDTHDLELHVAEAQANLDRANAAYAKLEAGASPEEIAVAQAQVDRAQAQLHQTRGGVTASDIAAAKARLAQAHASLAQLEAGPKPADRQSAQASADRADAALQDARANLSAAKSRAEAEVAKAANELRNRQDVYNQIYWQNRQASVNLAPGEDLPQEAKDREAAALRAAENADQALKQARIAYEAARQAEINGIDTATATAREAHANMDKLMAGADADKLAAAHAGLAQAEADLAKLIGDQRSGSLDGATADVAIAQAELQKLTIRPRETDLAAARAEIDSAKVALEQARLALAHATLISPISGAVALINLKVGELAPANEAAIITADLARWQIETTDLTELNIARVREGAPVTLTFDGLPGVAIDGTVNRIKPRGENRQGEITYVVVITPKVQDPRLRWNMTAAVSISTN